MSGGAPTARKLGASLALILGVGALPTQHAGWGLLAIPVLIAVAARARVELRVLWRRVLAVAPLLFGIAGLALVQGRGWPVSAGILAKTGVSMLTLQLLTQTTRISELLAALRRAHVPDVLCTTIALLHRYLFLLVEESKRMQRARAGRTLRGGRWALWGALGNSVGLLFVRTVSRAERVHAAMRSRGGA
jgi:cobalt/nickel transport system permease protein